MKGDVKVKLSKILAKRSAYPPPSLGLMLSEKTIEELVEHAFKPTSGSAHGQVEHLTRLGMYHQLRDKLGSREDTTKRRTLAISRSAKLANVLGLGATEIVETDFPETDILNLHQYEDQSFDFVVSDMVLEHVGGNPFEAFAETYRVLRPGGSFCHTTCFMVEIHEPIDMWRFTPSALAFMAKKHFTEVETGGAGSREWVGLMLTGFRKLPIPNDPENPIYKLALKAEPDFLTSIWVTGVKPEK